MEQQLKNWFTQGNLHQVIFKTSMPMVGAILALFSYDLLESTLLAFNGEDVLTALGFTLPITTAIAAIAIGTSIRTNNKVVKQACLQQDKVATTIVSSIVSSMFLISFLSLLFYLVNDFLLATLGSTSWSASSDNLSDITDSQQTYLNARYLGWLFLTVIWQVNGVFRALGKSALASALLFAWLLTKSLLAIVLLTPESSWHLVGLSSLAVNHLTIDLLFAVISMVLLINKVPLKWPSKAQFREIYFSPSTDNLAGLIVISQQLITPISFALLTMIAASIDSTYIAAFAIILRMESLFLLIPMVLTASMPCIIGINYWSGRIDRVKAAYFITFAVIVLSQSLIAILLYLNSDMLSYFVCSETSVARFISSYLTWVPLGYIGAGCAIVYQSCLNSEGKTLIASTIGITHRLLFLLPMALLGTVIDTENSFFQAIMFGHLLSGGYVIYLFKKQKSPALPPQKVQDALPLTNHQLDIN
ncbi:MAG: MATE family efflux transporter [Colwellia sp.]|nr:MATE family efflux transporter [Colwellia sp.]